MRAFVIDAFADAPFTGNPAGVVLLDAASSAPDAAWMQSVAAELKHSETAFVRARPDAAYDLRWFTPAVEVDLCGHATLASTHALYVTGAGSAFAFHTRSGVLRTEVDGGGAITMDFPVQPTAPVDAPAGLADALGAAPVSVHGNGIDVLVEVTDAATVRGLRPDMALLGALRCRGVIVTAAADPGTDHDFVSRFFGPAVGVPEDPVTGSAHCALAPFWSARLGRSELVGVQLSERGGRVATAVRDDRVLLTGGARTVLDGALLA